jgi:proteic killer suppression protein
VAPASAEGPRPQGAFSVWVSGNWRITFSFDGADAVLVNYFDHH